MTRNEFDAGKAVLERMRVGRESEAFKAGYAAAERMARTIVAENPLPREMMARGGWSAILFRTFRASAGNAKVPWLFGTEIAVEALFTALDVADIKLRAQKEARQ